MNSLSIDLRGIRKRLLAAVLLWKLCPPTKGLAPMGEQMVGMVVSAPVSGHLVQTWEAKSQLWCR